MKQHNFYLKIAFITLMIVFIAGCVKRPAYLNVNRCRNASTDKEILYNNIVLPNSPLTIDDIIKVGLKRNLALLVKRQECAIQKEIATSEKLTMLPELLMNGEWSERDNSPGSSSESLEPGVPPAPPSVSSRRQTGTADITLTWNLLDFGLSYYRSRQAANSVLVQQYEYKRLQQNLVLDLVKQYWIAVAAKQGIIGSKELIAKGEERKNQLHKKVKKRVISKAQALKMADQLVQMQIDLQAYQKEYDYAISDLKQLMGLPPSINFEIEENPETKEGVDLWNLAVLEDLSLRNRPELFSYDVQEMIDIDEVRAIILEMVPGISLFGSFNYNDNPFLLKNNWLLAGARATYNLLDLPNQYYQGRSARAQKMLTKKNRLLLAMGALSQVNLAYWIFHDDQQYFSLAKEKASIKEQLLEVALRQKKNGKLDEADIIQVETNALNAHVESLRAYGDMQISLEQINNAIGIPQLFRMN
ncbi:MAG: TolC family protein [Chlamydiota bacterium]|nr:TolC family protein [Chlamydiota bacterium]